MSLKAIATLGMLMLGVAIFLCLQVDAATARWLGGTNPGCGNTSGNEHQCGIFVCVSGGYECSSSFTQGIAPGGGIRYLCVCTDSGPGC